MITTPKIDDNLNCDDVFEASKKTPYQKIAGKYIYKTRNNKWTIQKSINGKNEYFGVYDTFNQAVKSRDKLIENDWKILTPQVDTIEDKTRKYYKSIYLTKNKKAYIVKYKGEYITYTKSIEEALYARDLIYKYTPKKIDIKSVTLTENNPYIINGLDYPLPHKLKLKPKNNPKITNYTYIRKKGEQSFQIRKHINGELKYFGTYATLEYARYIRDELIKNDWNEEKLSEIKDNYKYYYTNSLNLFKYIRPMNNGKWLFLYQEYAMGDDGKPFVTTLESFGGWTNIEDAMWERDLYFEHKGDEVSMCEDNRENPYYKMDLPAYPSRLKRNRKQKDHKPILENLKKLIQDGMTLQWECAKELNMKNITNILHKYNTNWDEFKVLALADEDLSVLEARENIIIPDVSVHYKNNNYVSRDNDKYRVQRRGVYYGRYDDLKTATKVSKALEKVNWDKSKLNSIRKKYNCESKVNSKRWVYKHGNKYYIRKTNENKKIINYGSYKDKRLAEKVRDKLVIHKWNKDLLPKIQVEALTELYL